MICPKCGEEVPQELETCPNCGAAMTAPEQDADSQPAETSAEVEENTQPAEETEEAQDAVEETETEEARLRRPRKRTSPQRLLRFR